QIEVHDVERGGAPTRRSGPASDPTAALGALLGSFRAVPQPGLPRFFGGAVGYLGYDAVRAFERLPQRHASDGAIPAAMVVVTDTLVIFDNLHQTVKVVANAVVDAPDDAARSYDAACARIDAIVEALERPSERLAALDPGAPATGRVPLEADVTRDQFKAA